MAREGHILLLLSAEIDACERRLEDLQTAERVLVGLGVTGKEIAKMLEEATDSRTLPEADPLA